MIRPRILGAGCDKHLGTEHFWCCDAANTAAMYVALSTRLEPRNNLSVAAGGNPCLSHRRALAAQCVLRTGGR